MQIVLEGPDGGGKSTLAERLKHSLRMSIKVGDGPEKHPGEILDRINDYAWLPDNLIFDRHPIISHPIYRNDKMTVLPEDLVKSFYTVNRLIVYCRPTLVSKHELNHHDTPEHVEHITKNHDRIRAAYDAWALERAHLIYRCGEGLDEFVTRIRRIL